MNFGHTISTRTLVARIKSRYPFSHRMLNTLTSSPKVEREFGPHGSYVEGKDRVYCFADEAVRNRFKEKYP